MGTLATDDQDKELMAIWEFIIYDSSGILYGGLSRECYEAYLVTLTDRYLVPSPSETWFRGLSVGRYFRRV